MDCKYRYIALVISTMTLLIVGCQSSGSIDNKPEADEIISCEFSSREDVSQIKAIFSSASIIPIEQQTNSIVSSDCEILIFDSDYILLNKKMRSCIRFDKNGRYKNHIGRSGRASDEYLDIASAQIDGDNILIYSNTKATIYRYDIDGNLLGSTDTSIRAQQILKIGENYLGYFGYDNGQQEERILIYDKNFNKIGQYLPSKAKLIVFSEDVDPLTIQGGDVYIRETYNNCIHKILSDGELSTPLGFDFKSYNIPSKCFNQPDAFKAAEMILSNNFASIYRFEDSSNHSFVQINYQMVNEEVNIYSRIGVRDRSSDFRWITATPSGSNAILFSSIRHLCDNGELIALVDRNIVEDFNSKSIGFIDNFEILKFVEGDNPVIVKLKIE